MATVHHTELSRGASKQDRTPRRFGGSRGFKAVGHCAKDPLAAAAAQRGIAEARLISRWTEIVGPRIAAVARPVRVRHRRGAALGAVLVLAVDGARATELEFLSPQIIERVNAGYGYGAIAEIAFTQATGPLPAMGGEDGTAPVRPEDLSDDKRERLDAMTRPVQDDALRDALARLGANVMGRDGTRSAKKRPISKR